MSLQKRSEEETNKELEDYRRFVYYKPNTLPILFGRKEVSPLQSAKSTKTIELKSMQAKSQLKGSKL